MADMSMRRIFFVLAAILVANTAAADTATLTIPAGSGQDVTIMVPAGTRLLKISATATQATPGTLTIYARPAVNNDDAGFDVGGDLQAQARYRSSDTPGAASLAIIDEQRESLAQGRWFVALANRGTGTATVTLTTAVATSAVASNLDAKTFTINFDQPSAAVKNSFGDDFKCDTTPWNDQTPLDSDDDGEPDTTLGAFRKSLLQQAADKLATQIHTPIPIRVQACWKSYGNADDAKSYTLAAAGPTYLFTNFGAGAKPDTWYATAPAMRMAGATLCQLDNSIPCDMPAILVFYNSDKIAQTAYDDASDEPLIITTTMHELTHGLGFLSQVNSGDAGKYKDDRTKDPKFGDLFNNKNDAFTLLVGYAKDSNVTSYADLSKADRTLALTSVTGLVINDPDLAANLANSQHDKAFPDNLTRLYAPKKFNPGSTLSHFDDDTHPGQLMDHFIQHNHPTTLGLAEPVLEQVGWSTGPTPAPIPGAWYDPAHSGHGIDLQPILRDPEGDQYSVLFYTYDDSGEPAFFFSSGRLRDGHYDSIAEAGVPAQLYRPQYDAVGHKAVVDPAYSGTLSIDFTNYAPADPACADRSGPSLALMHWTINGTSRTWCIGPLLGTSDRPAAANDLNGLWNGGASDSGWGMSVINKANDSSAPTLNPVLLYYYDGDNKSRWAEAAYSDYQAGATTPLYTLAGYCRVCAKPAGSLPAVQAGTLTLNLTRPDDSTPPSDSNTLSFMIDAAMQRNNVRVRMYSLPAGK